MIREMIRAIEAGRDPSGIQTGASPGPERLVNTPFDPILIRIVDLDQRPGRGSPRFAR
jgi:hypothetical protein